MNKKEEKRWWRVDCWIQVPHDEVEDQEIFTSTQFAQFEVDHCEAMQPENKYEIVECKADGKDLD